MKHLYVIGVGGSISKANIEVHDIHFVTAKSFEATHEVLKELWYGESLHVDSYGVLAYVDGHTIEVVNEVEQDAVKDAVKDAITEVDNESGSLHLYFVYMGGYNKDVFGELHEMGFFVAESSEAAKQKAIKSLLIGADQKHVDEIRQVDHVMKDADNDKVMLKLDPVQSGTSFRPEWNGYLKLVPRKKVL